MNKSFNNQQKNRLTLRLEPATPQKESNTLTTSASMHFKLCVKKRILSISKIQRNRKNDSFVSFLFVVYL